MTASHVDKLRAIVEAMTPGPYEVPFDEPFVLDEEDARGIAALLATAPELLAVVEAVLLDHDQSIGPEEQAEGVKQWWKLPATKAALDALDARIREALPCPECIGAGVVETAQTSGGGPIDAPCGACRPGERERWEAR